MANPKPLGSDSLAKIKKQFSPFFREIKKRLLLTLLAFLISTLAGFVFYEEIIKFLVSLLPFEGINIVFTSPFQFVNLAISCGLATGMIVGFPVFILQIISFLRPALRKNEYRILSRLLPFSMVLFLSGLIFGAVIMRWQIKTSLVQSALLGIGNMLDISKLISTIIITASLMGIGFQFPIILLILLRLDFIDSRQLSKRRFKIYLASFVFTLFLPLDSVLADFFLTLPLIFLFEMTLVLNRLLKGKQKSARLSAKLAKAVKLLLVGAGSFLIAVGLALFFLSQSSLD